MLRLLISKKFLVFAVADACLIAFGVWSGLAVRHYGDAETLQYFTSLPDFAYRLVAVLIAFQLSGYYNGLYELRQRRTFGDHFFRVCLALGVGCVALACLYFGIPALRLGRSAFAIAVAITVFLLAIFRWLIDLVWSSAISKENVLIVGSNELAGEVAEALESRPDLNLRLAGFVSDPNLDQASTTDPKPTDPKPTDPIIGSIADLEGIAARYQADRVVVALEAGGGALPIKQLLRLKTRGVRVEDAHSTISFLSGRVPVRSMPTSWLVFSDGFRRGRLTMSLKRIIDLAGAVFGLIVSAPTMLIVALAVKIDSEGAVFYRQQRVGLHGKTFSLEKFRTMRSDAEADGVPRWSQENDPRVTRLGRFLRKYRFDELPQFLNIIKGEMSFVGPRPERPEFVTTLSETIPFYEERHTVRPGLTGWAQVCYPYGSSVEDAVRKLEFELFYLKNVSILFDFAILFQTIRIVLLGRGR